MIASRIAALMLIAAAGCAGPSRGTIGAVLGRAPDGRVTIRDAPEDLGAAKAGLQPGDEILLIDGQDVRALDENELRRALGGAVGERVKLTVIRGEEVHRVTVERSEARRRFGTTPR